MAIYIDADAYIKYCEEKWIPLNIDAVLAQPKITNVRKNIRAHWEDCSNGIGDAPCRSCYVDDMKDEIETAQTADVVEIKKEGEWDMFDLISSAYYGKGMYFKEDDGKVYSRYSHEYMSVDEAIREFISLIDGTEWDDAEIH